MTLEQAIKYFGNGNKLCKALCIERSNITDWRNKGYVPMIQQLRLEKLTKGALMADKDIIE